jgi:hypothetical protein
MSFLIIPFGSYGLPKNRVLPGTSYAALAILCQIIGAILLKPILRQCSCIEAWRGTTLCSPLFFRLDKHTSPTTQIILPQVQVHQNIFSRLYLIHLEIFHNLEYVQFVPQHHDISLASNMVEMLTLNGYF